MNFDYGLYIVFSIILASGILMISTENPIHAILFLILMFFNGSLLFFLIGFEFFALIFLIIYVGAIIVLFLFMIMLLNIKYNDPKNINSLFLREDYLLIGALMLILLLGLLFIMRDVIYPGYFFDYEIIFLSLVDIRLLAYDNYQNLLVLGRELYSNYIFAFIIVGLLLLISMIGAILIAIEDDKEHKKILMKTQDLMDQAERNSKNSIYFSYQEFFIQVSEEEKNLYKKLLSK